MSPEINICFMFFEKKIEKENCEWKGLTINEIMIIVWSVRKKGVEVFDRTFFLFFKGFFFLVQTCCHNKVYLST